MGAVLLPHRADHAYTVVEEVSAPAFQEGWSAAEEVRLLDAIARFGPCSWRSVAEMVGGGKTGRACELHYGRVYLRGGKGEAEGEAEGEGQGGGGIGQGLLPLFDTVLEEEAVLEKREEAVKKKERERVRARKELAALRDEEQEAAANIGGDVGNVGEKDSRKVRSKKVVVEVGGEEDSEGDFDGDADYVPEVAEYEVDEVWEEVGEDAGGVVAFFGSDVEELEVADEEKPRKKKGSGFTGGGGVRRGRAGRLGRVRRKRRAVGDEDADGEEVGVNGNGRGGAAATVRRRNRRSTGVKDSQWEEVEDFIVSEGDHVGSGEEVDGGGGDDRAMSDSGEEGEDSPEFAASPAGGLEGYMEKRGDFDVEWDDSAEEMLADMVIGDDDTEEERALKLRVLEIYDERLAERERVKDVVLSQNLLDFPAVAAAQSAVAPEERELVSWLSRFDRILSPDDCRELRETVLAEERVRRHIERIEQYRAVGIRTFEEVRKYDLDAMDRIDSLGLPYSDPPPPLSVPDGAAQTGAAESFSKVSGAQKILPAWQPARRGSSPAATALSTGEREVCAALHLTPDQFLKIREVVLAKADMLGYGSAELSDDAVTVMRVKVDAQVSPAKVVVADAALLRREQAEVKGFDVPVDLDCPRVLPVYQSGIHAGGRSPPPSSKLKLRISEPLGGDFKEEIAPSPTPFVPDDDCVLVSSTGGRRIRRKKEVDAGCVRADTTAISLAGAEVTGTGVASRLKASKKVDSGMSRWETPRLQEADLPIDVDKLCDSPDSAPQLPSVSIKPPSLEEDSMTPTHTEHDREASNPSGLVNGTRSRNTPRRAPSAPSAQIVTPVDDSTSRRTADMTELAIEGRSARDASNKIVPLHSVDYGVPSVPSVGADEGKAENVDAHDARGEKASVKPAATPGSGRRGSGRWRGGRRARVRGRDRGGGSARGVLGRVVTLEDEVDELSDVAGTNAGNGTVVQSGRASRSSRGRFVSEAVAVRQVSDDQSLATVSRKRGRATFEASDSNVKKHSKDAKRGSANRRTGQDAVSEESDGSKIGRDEPSSPTPLAAPDTPVSGRPSISARSLRSSDKRYGLRSRDN